MNIEGQNIAKEGVVSIDEEICNNANRNNEHEREKICANEENSKDESACGNTIGKKCSYENSTESNIYGSENESLIDEKNCENEENIPHAKEQISVRNEIAPDGTWVVRTYTGYIVTHTVHPDKGRPENFETAKAEMMWNTAIEINLRRFKHQIQTGEYFPPEAIIEVDPDPLKAPTTSYCHSSVIVEPEEKRRENVQVWNRKKIEFLKSELVLVDLIINIRENFTGVHQLHEGLNLLNNVLQLDITTMMLKKNPFVMNTIFCLCSYAGMNTQSEVDDGVIIEEIKGKAQQIYNKFKSLFTVPVGYSFEDYFRERSTFMWKILGFDAHRAYEFVDDPTPVVQTNTLF